VEAVFRGEKEAVLKMIELCKQGPPLARVDQVRIVDESGGRRESLLY
jgi:acylphosphatase